VKLRLHGTGEEVAEASRRLLEALEVVAVSDPSPDRRASVLVRVDLEVRLGPTTPAALVGSASPARRPGP
jgi:hypothetical protein